MGHAGNCSSAPLSLQTRHFANRLHLVKAVRKIISRTRLFDAAASIQDATATEGIIGHVVALRWAMFHSALKPENSVR